MRWTAAVAIAVLALALTSAPVASRAANAPHVTAKQPAPGLRLRTYFPMLSASIAPAPRANSLHVFLDGRDVSGSISLRSGKLHYIPSERVAAGWHDVFLEGTGANGEPFSDSWAFQTVAPDINETPTVSNFEFFPSGGTTFFPGRFMHFFFIAPIDGFAILQLCGLGAFPFAHEPFSPVFFVTVPVPEIEVNPFLNCQVQAVFTPEDEGFNPVFVPLPIGIGIFSHRHHEIMSGQGTPRTTIPVFRQPPREIAPSMTQPAYGSVTMPVYRSVPAPIYRSVPMPMPVYRPVPMPRPVYRSVPMPMPVYRSLPMQRPISIPRPMVPARPRCCSR